MFDKCPCGKSCCKRGTCASCAEDALGEERPLMMGHHGAGKHILGVLVAVFLISMIALNAKQFAYLRDASEDHLISVSGDGRATAVPNIAVTNVGLVTEKASVAEAQSENTRKMNDLIAAIKKLDISPDDITTAQYQIYPKYSYDQKSGSNITGYSVTQSVEIKIRDLTKISAVLAKAGEAGANQVSGIQFTMDDPKVIQGQARDVAIADAKAKAEKLEKQLGVEFSEPVGFSENYDSGSQPMPMMAFSEAKVGVGGGVPAPDIQSGSLDVHSRVTITYQIKD